MKNISFVLIGFMLSLSVKGQSIFERFADYDDVSLVSISPKMFKMLGQLSVSLDDPEAQEYIDMVSSIENFKVLISGNDEVSDAMSKWAAEQLSSKDLEELMTIKDSDADVAFYVKSGKSDDRVEKLIMYVNGVNPKIMKDSPLGERTVETIILLIEGNIDLKQISKLTDQMSLPGGKQLRKASGVPSAAPTIIIKPNKSS
ncbi:DUF4252 domain-containing protein [Flavobacteriaceae bacterium]|nr:DUF4252 domain-containing protein [Flavobacteriaceae bacterium]